MREEEVGKADRASLERLGRWGCGYVEEDW